MSLADVISLATATVALASVVFAGGGAVARLADLRRRVERLEQGNGSQGGRLGDLAERIAALEAIAQAPPRRRATLPAAPAPARPLAEDPED